MNLVHLKDYILSFEYAKRDLKEKLAKVREEVVYRMEIAIVQAKAAKVPRDTTKAKYIKLEVISFIEINKLKTDLSDSNKEVKMSRAIIQKLHEEKEKLEKGDNERRSYYFHASRQCGSKYY